MLIRKSRILIVVVMILIVIAVTNTTIVRADVPYNTYSYNYWGEAVMQPHVYLYSGTINKDKMGVTLNAPKDMVIRGGYIYIADTGNSRVIRMTSEGDVNLVIEFASTEDDLLNKPQGIFVDANEHIYVADSANGRIIEYDKNGSYLRQIGRPDTELITSQTAYVPTKLVVDKSGNIYVTAYGINMGLVEFDRTGTFQGFMGATAVAVSPFEYIWKNYFSTEEQQMRMQTIVPTEYSNIFLDNENFIYGTINNLDDEDIMQGSHMVRRLNPTGTDVLRRLGNINIIGDLYSSSDAKFSSFTDICANSYGCYFVLDVTAGKVFSYDYDGNSLFAFGGTGVRDGNTMNPSAIGISEDDQMIYILDSQLGSILTYEITDYGRNLLGAIKSNRMGDSEAAFTQWEKVLELNANNELAYIGLGKASLKEGDYKEAMTYFKLGNSKKYYSRAFYFYRKELMQENFGKSMIMAGGIILLVITIRGIRKLKRWVGEVKCFMQNL